MISNKVFVLTLLTIATALPTQWRTAIVKRDVKGLATEYDYIVGK